MNTSETNVKLVGMTKIDDNKPPRITRLLHVNNLNWEIDLNNGIMIERKWLFYY